MHRRPRLTATIAPVTSERLQRLSESTGLDTDTIVELALSSYLEAFEALPEEGRVPQRLVIDGPAFDRIVDRIRNPTAPTPALCELMGHPLE